MEEAEEAVEAGGQLFGRPAQFSNMGKVKMATFDVTAIAAKNRTDSSEIGAHTG